MRNHEAAMLAYVQLAEVSMRKSQPLGCVRFLALAGITACRAGWPDVADRCRQLILLQNPRHLIGNFPTIPDALRSAEFEPFVRRLERSCPYEKAEHLLREAGIEAPGGTELAAGTAGQTALAMLSGDAWT